MTKEETRQQFKESGKAGAAALAAFDMMVKAAEDKTQVALCDHVIDAIVGTIVGVMALESLARKEGGEDSMALAQEAAEALSVSVRDLVFSHA